MFEFSWANIKTTRIATEIRYANNVLFYDVSKLNTIFRQVSDQFKQNNYDSVNKQFILINPEKKCIATILPDKAVINMDDIIEFSAFKKFANSFFENTCNLLEIKEIERTGIRYFIGLPCSDLSEANAFLKDAFLKISSKQWDVLSGPPSSIGLRFQIEGQPCINISFQAITEQFIEINGVTQVKNEERKVLQIDCDIYSLTTKPPGINGFLNNSYNIIEKNVFPFLNLLKENVDG